MTVGGGGDMHIYAKFPENEQRTFLEAMVHSASSAPLLWLLPDCASKLSSADLSESALCWYNSTLPSLEG